MDLHIYSIYDAKAEAYIQPFFATNEGMAKRMFHKACNDQETDFWKYSQDYTLFFIGFFSQTTGLLHPNKAPETLGGALEYKGKLTNGSE